MKIITRPAALRLSVLFVVIALIAWRSGAIARYETTRLPEETRQALQRLQAAMPQPNQDTDDKAAELHNLLNQLGSTFFFVDDKISPWLVSEEMSIVFKLAPGASAEDLPEEFYAALEDFLEWHFQERDPVLPCSLPRAFTNSELFFALALNLDLMVQILPPEKQQVFCQALAHAAYFQWTASANDYDLLFCNAVWKSLGERYPSAEERKRFAGLWAPDFYPASLRITSGLLLYKQSVVRTPMQRLRYIWGFANGEGYVEDLPEAVDLCEQLLATRGTTNTEAQVSSIVEELDSTSVAIFLGVSGHLYESFPR